MKMKNIILILITLIVNSCMNSQKTKYPPEEYFQGKDVEMAKAIYCHLISKTQIPFILVKVSVIAF